MSLSAKKERNSSIELLRIIMMLQIVFLHICDYGEYMKNAKELGGIHQLLMWFFWLMSRCPVFLFIIIMGYFMIYSEKKNILGRILKVYIPMYFYSIIIPVVAALTGVVQIEKSDIISAFFPMLSRTWYFMTLYILVIIFSPYLNIILNRISKRDYILLLLALFFIFSIWQPIAKLEFFSEVIEIGKIINTEDGKSLYDFIYMYILGGFIRRFVVVGKGDGIGGETQKGLEKAGDVKIRIRWCNAVNLLIFFAAGIINLIMVYEVPGYDDIVGYNDNPFVVIQCIFLFLFFANLKFHSKIINSISALNLGVYMLHEHPLGREILWGKIVKMDHISFYNSNIYILKLALICISIYLTCAFIEWIRNFLFNFCKGLWRTRRNR